MRALGFLFFLAVIGGVSWLVLSSGRLEGIGATAPTTELGVAEAAAGDLRDLEDVIEDALANARRAAALADEMDVASDEARSAADSLLILASDNDAARPSAEAARQAADDAEEAALLMRRYADALAARFRVADASAEEAEAITDMAVAVEETQAEAERAAAEARAARAEMIRTEDVAEELDGPEAGDFRGDIVVIDGDDDGDAVRERLDDIFPDDVIEYEDAPYGERG